LRSKLYGLLKRYRAHAMSGQAKVALTKTFAMIYYWAFGASAVLTKKSRVEHNRHGKRRNQRTGVSRREVAVFIEATEWFEKYSAESREFAAGIQGDI
jgi:hypothetical protein